MINSQLKKGLLDVCVLSVLNRESSYGYKILKDLTGYVDLSESTLYPVLRRLESNGHVISHSVEHNGRLRKMYSVTPSGKALIYEFLEEWKEIEKIHRYIKEGFEHE